MTTATMTEPNMLEEALWYNAKGFRILPVHWATSTGCSCGKPKCSTPAKHPLVRHGVDAAATLTSQIEGWWTRWPRANIGLATGGKILVLDGDPRNGGPSTTGELIERFGPTPETAEAITGGGGRHWFFSFSGYKVPANIEPGLDLKGGGGYVLVEPSLHISGRRYAFDGIEGREALLHPAEAPAWLLARIKAANGKGKPTAAPTEGKIPHGTQHNTLVRFAGVMRNGGAGFDEIFAALIVMNRERCEKPGPEANIRKIAESVCKYAPGKIYLGAEPEDGGGKKQPEPTAGKKPSAQVITISELAQMELTEAPYIIDELLTAPGCWSLVGGQKTGKTLFATQLALSYQRPTAFLDYYKTLESRGVLFIEQDDSAGVGAVRRILEKSPIAADPEKFFPVKDAAFTIGPEMIRWLETEITSRDIGMVILDSYTAMRPARGAGSDIVKSESRDFRLLDDLAKRTKCIIIMLHHKSKGSAALDWMNQAAGSYAISAAVEGEIHLSRFREQPIDARERLVQIYGRNVRGKELVIRFRPETLDYEFVLEGAAATLYPTVLEMKTAFGARVFTPKDLKNELGLPHATAHRLLSRLMGAGVLHRHGFGEYELARGVQ